MLKIVKRWFSDIADLRPKHKLVVVMRNNAGENKSQESINFFESVGLKNYFSTAHEQWQNVLPVEQSIRSWWQHGQSWLNLDWAVDSSPRQHWLHGMLAMLPTRRSLALLLGGGCMARCDMFLDFVHLGAGHWFISILTDERRASILPAQLRQSLWIQTQHKRILLLYSGEDQFNDIKSSETWWIFVSTVKFRIQEAENGWAVSVWQIKRHTV